MGAPAETQSPQEGRADERNGAPPRDRTIAASIILLALASYLIRIIIPLGTFVVEFPTLSYLPQYLELLHHRHRRGPAQLVCDHPEVDGQDGIFDRRDRNGHPLPLALIGGAAFIGNGSWSSVVYALWDSTVAVGMALGPITLFRDDRFNHSGRFFRFLQRHSYTVYFIQAPLIVLVAVSLKDLVLPPFVKFVLVSFITVPFCFVVAYLILKIPYADRVL